MPFLATLTIFIEFIDVLLSSLNKLNKSFVIIDLFTSISWLAFGLSGNLAQALDNMIVFEDQNVLLGKLKGFWDVFGIWYFGEKALIVILLFSLSSLWERMTWNIVQTHTLTTSKILRGVLTKNEWKKHFFFSLAKIINRKNTKKDLNGLLGLFWRRESSFWMPIEKSICPLKHLWLFFCRLWIAFWDVK